MFQGKLAISSPQEAMAMLKVLANRFKIPEPALRWAPNKKRNSHYKPALNRITLAAGRTPEHWEESLVHEFTHHLCHCKQIQVNHDRMFWQLLWLVAEEWYGRVLGMEKGAENYPWHREYATGRYLAANGFHTVMRTAYENRKEKKDGQD